VTRLFGFITTAMGEPAREASQPVANLIVRLESAAGRKSSTTNQRGRFALDGLSEGDYALTIYDGEYPERERILKGPVKLHLPATGFARQDIYILPELLKKP
jgi:hypothetical protein